MRTASRRARRLAALLLLAVTVCWAFVRRRSSAVRWVEPPPILPTGGAAAGASAEPGLPGELPQDVLATDAGLTELPETDEASPDTVDETRITELLAESPDADVVVVDEATFEQAVADAAPEPAEAGSSADAEVVATGPEAAEPAKGTSEAELEADQPSTAAETARGIEESTVTIQPELDEDSGREIPMPTVDEAPTGEIPAVTDDLRAVRGIGPTMESKLHGLGIVSYRQLALLDGADLERAELADFRSRIEREDWVGQARDLHRDKYGRNPS